MKELDGKQVGQLRDALLKAFPESSELEQMVLIGLGVKLAEIVPNGTMKYTVFKLILWAQSQGKAEDLIHAALENSNHPDLSEVANQIGFKIVSGKALDTSSSSSLTVNVGTKEEALIDPPISPIARTVAVSTFDVFISYSHKDQTWVKDWLVRRLRDEGLSVCIDYDSFQPALSTVENIEWAILNSKKTVLVLSPNYWESAWSKFENILTQTFFMKAPSSGLISVLHQKCDPETIPLRIKSFTWLDFTQLKDEEFQFRRLVATIRDQPLLYHIIPLGNNLSVPPVPYGSVLPSGYLYLGEPGDTSSKHFYREQDSHVAVLFPGQEGKVSPFLIDKYAITNQQFCMFLNDLLNKKRARVIDRFPGQRITRCTDTNGRVLALDARDYWEDQGRQVAQPWGIFYQDGRWQPFTSCDLLPATLVSWWGAHQYSLWAHRLLDKDTPSSCLPTEQLWRYAAQFDPKDGKVHRYSWGKEWSRSSVNYAGFWSDKEVRTTAEREDEWHHNPSAYKRARPLPVADLAQACNPIGCVQLIGNVWEWCSDSPGGHPERHIIKGGACNSPQEQCNPEFSESWLDSSEYIGFRCLYVLA